jgi:flagellar export protein FliJ
MARKTFRYRLQRLLEIRVMQEELERSKLLAAQQVVRNEQIRLEDLELEAAAYAARLMPAVGKAIDFEDILLSEFALKAKEQECDAQRGVIAQKQQIVEQQKKVLKEASIRVKALEKLKERQLEEFREEQLREEGLFLDDLAGQQFIRQVQQERLLAEEQEAEEIA